MSLTNCLQYLCTVQDACVHCQPTKGSTENCVPDHDEDRAIYLPCFSPHRVCMSIDQCLTLHSVCRCIPVCTTVILIGAVCVCVCVCACVCSGLVCFHVDFETFFFVYIFPYLLCTCVCLFCPEQYGGILYGLDLEAVEQ